MFRILTLIVSLLVSSVVYSEVYQWRDASGSVVFGDSPPESAGARTVDLPLLTIADGYKSPEKKKNGSQAAVKTGAAAERDKAKTVAYSRFSVKSPDAGDAIRSNNGNLLVRLELEPALQAGHGIALYLDGKQVASGTATVFSLESISRGKHTVFAVLHDENDGVLRNTQSVSFNLLRVSRI